MPAPPRTPVIVGRAQIVRTPEDLDSPHDAIDLLHEAAAEALADAGIAASEVDTVGVVTGLYRHRNPARVVADAIETGPCHTILTTWGGNTPVAFVGEIGDRIADWTIDVALVLGGEANLTRDAFRHAGRELPRRDPGDDLDEPETWGPPLVMAAAADRERGADHPRNSYAVFESARRAATGESVDECRDRTARLWAGYSAVASNNPDVDVEPTSAADIRAASPSNRMVSWPYTKAMCANNRVDHAGALLMMSAEAADRLGVDDDQRVYLHDTVNGSDTDSFLTRRTLAEVPGLDDLADELRSTWGPIGDIAHLDLYGCFPSIVQYTADRLEIPTDRPLTVTGGLGFMGAPLNFAAGQSLIAMVRTLRDEPGTFGLVQGNGGHAAKHSFGVYSTTPPDHVVRTRSLPTATEDRPAADPERSGQAEIDGITVEFDRDGPTRAIAACRFDDGLRLWATSTDPELLAIAVDRELIGSAVDVIEGEFSLR